MATAAVEIPHSNHVLPGSHMLQTIQFPDATAQSQVPDPSVEDIALNWVEAWNTAVKTDQAFSSLFIQDSCWRDLLCLSWDFRTLQGRAKIDEYAKNSSATTPMLSLDTSSNHKKPQAITVAGIDVVQAFLKVDTNVGRGEGLVRLVKPPSDTAAWAAFTFFTTLRELKGYEEHTNARRPAGTERDPSNSGSNWADQRNAQQNFAGGREPVVLIIGAGQGGLTAAARLKQLGIEALIIDQNPRIGDNWRNRYHQLVLHDSVWCATRPKLQLVIYHSHNDAGTTICHI